VALVALLAAAVCCAVPVESEAAGQLKGIRSSAEADSTRVIIELSEVRSYRYGVLPGDAKKGLPARLYVDIEGIKLERNRKVELWVGDQRVKQVRAGQNTLQKARVVLELEGMVKPTVFALESPPRIVIELKGTGAASRGAPVVAKPGTVKAPPVRPSSSKPATAVVPRGTVFAPVARVGGRSESVRKVRIVIDAGHGGKDPGARGYGGSQEKHGALDIARRLAGKLKDRLGFHVLMTRQSDKYVGLSERKDMANRVNADLFVSVHLNASKNTRLKGIETYYLKNSNDRATLRLATMENGVDDMIDGDVSSDADLSYIVSDIIQGQKEAYSIRAARHIQDSLVGHLKPRYSSISNLGVKQGPFLVLDGTYMPSVLVEAGFISHSVEGKRLTSNSYRDAVAEGLYRGIKRYFEDDRTAQLR
jgi:N-acetylmuramoyl-L-alanine amidase